MTIHEHLKNIGACKDAKKWALQFNTAQEVWDNNKKIDWLFWWAVRCGQAMNVAMAAKEIANSVQHIKNENSTAAYDAYAAAAAADAAAAAVLLMLLIMLLLLLLMLLLMLLLLMLLLLLLMLLMLLLMLLLLLMMLLMMLLYCC